MKNRKVEELTLEEIEQFLDQLKPDTSMVLSGGEPFERKDMDDIIKAVKIRKLPCTIVTNGFALNEKNIETILTQGVESVIVSLHGPEEIHNSITGNRTAFKNALWTLRQLTHDKKRKTKVIINAVISPETISCLDDLMEIAKKCEVDLVKFEHLHFTKEKETNKAYTTYTTKDPSVDAAKLYDKLCLYSSQSIPVIVKPNLTKKEFMKWYTTFDHLERSCPFVYHSMILSSDGNIYPCQHMYESMGNIKTELLKDIWNNEKFRSFRKKIHKNPKQMCYRCCKI